MDTLSLSQLRENPALLADAGQRVMVARSGEEVATVSIRLTPKCDPQQARESIDRWLERSKNIKPNARNGGAAAVRRLRDGR